MTQKRKEIKLLVLSLLFFGVVVYAVYQLSIEPFLPKFSNFFQPIDSQTTQQQIISLGEKVLITADTNPDKEAGVRAFAQGDFATASIKFKSYLHKNQNDPETVLYLNNALASSKNALKIAAIVPIGGNLNVAKEVLRGVAQAQDEINRNGGINGKLLQVEIANDNNDPDTAKKLADKFVFDRSVLAVVGHNSSDASIASAPVYQHGGLVMISPTSTADELSGIGSYVFRTVPSISFDAETLSRYVIKTAHLNKVGICADFQDKASQSFSAQFTKHMQANGGRVVPTHCDFSSANFDPSTAVSSAVSAGADSLLLAPSVNKLQKAIDIARANQDKLSLFSYSVMYTIQTLYSGQAAVKGMVLTVPWYPLTSEPFVQKAKTLWGGSVSWRTAMAYDATQAIITGLRQSNTRNGLQQVLHSPNFLAQSATASTTVKFLPSGDSDGTAILVQVQPGNNSGTGYDFVLSP